MSRWMVAAGAIIFIVVSGRVEAQEGLVLPSRARATASTEVGWMRVRGLAFGTQLNVITKTGSFLSGFFDRATDRDVTVHDVAGRTTTLPRVQIAEVVTQRKRLRHPAALGALIGTGAGFAIAAAAGATATRTIRECGPLPVLIISGVGAGAGAAIGAATGRQRASDFDVIYRD